MAPPGGVGVLRKIPVPFGLLNVAKDSWKRGKGEGKREKGEGEGKREKGNGKRETGGVKSFHV